MHIHAYTNLHHISTKTKTQSTNPTPEIMTELDPQVIVEEDNLPSDEDKSSTSPLIELASLLRSMKLKSDAGKFKEPELFTGQDPKKLKTYIFQCQQYFQSLSDFIDGTDKSISPCPILRMWPKNGLNLESLDFFPNLLFGSIIGKPLFKNFDIILVLSMK